MKFAELLLWTILGLFIAVAIERLIAHFCRRADEDVSRLDAAMEAMRDQQKSLDALLAREIVPELVKEWLIVFAEAAITKSGAHALLGRVFGERQEIPEEVQRKVDAFLPATNQIKL